MSHAEFHNQLRILLSLERGELEAQGLSPAQADRIVSDPIDAFIFSDEQLGNAVFRAIDVRVWRRVSAEFPAVDTLPAPMTPPPVARYQADDGTLFPTQAECLAYEARGAASGSRA